MTLTEFLTARFDHDEAVARADLASYPWNTIDPADPDGDFDPENLHEPHSPYRQLDEVESKRAIVDLLGDRARMALEDDEPLSSWSLDVQNAVVILRELARPYRDHPDFDPSWKLAR